MIVLYIILGILALLCILLLIPVRVYVNFHYIEPSELKFETFIRYMFLKIKIDSSQTKEEPQKEGQEEKKDEPEKKPEEEKDKTSGILDKIMKEYTFAEKKRLLKDIFHIIGKLLKGIFKHIKISDLDLSFCIVGDNSYHTALYYGYACAVTYPLFNLLENYSKKIVNPQIKPYVDFTAEGTQLDCEFCIKFTMFFILVSAVATGARVLKLYWQIRKK